MKLSNCLTAKFLFKSEVFVELFKSLKDENQRFRDPVCRQHSSAGAGGGKNPLHGSSAWGCHLELPLSIQLAAMRADPSKAAPTANEFGRRIF